VDEGHSAFLHAVPDQKVVLGPGDHVDDGVADAENVVSCLRHAEPLFFGARTIAIAGWRTTRGRRWLKPGVELCVGPFGQSLAPMPLPWHVARHSRITACAQSGPRSLDLRRVRAARGGLTMPIQERVFSGVQPT